MIFANPLTWFLFGLICLFAGFFAANFFLKNTNEVLKWTEHQKKKKE